MGYLFLSIAILSGATKGFCGKKSSNYVKTPIDATFINFVRMCLCIVIGVAFVLFDNENVRYSNTMLLISIISGVATSAFVITWMMSIRGNAYMLVDVFLMIGVIVTISLCRIFYKEEIKWTQIVGIVLLLIATVIMCFYNKTIKGKTSVRQIILLIFCGTINGIADFTQKWFAKSCTGQSPASFNLFTYVFSTIVLGVFFAIQTVREKKKALLLNSEENIIETKTNEDDNKENSVKEELKIYKNKKIYIYVLIMAVCLFLNSYFKTLSANFLNASIMYPLNQGGSLILSLLMSIIFFKEKINWKCILGLILAFSALIIINVL